MLSSSRHARVWVLLFLGSILGILACSSDDPTEPPPPEVRTIKEVVESTGWFPEVSPDSVAWALARYDSTGGGSEPLACTYLEGTETRVLDELTMLVPENDLQYPGAILQWASLDGTTPLPVLADRAGGSIALTTPGGDEINGDVAVVEPAAVATWRADALAQLGDVAPAPWRLAAGAVYNPDHLSVVAGLGPDGMTAEAWQRLAMRDEATGSVLLLLRRINHTVACPYPGSSTAAFASQVTGEDIADQMAEGNPPVWVAAVDYGEFLYVLVEAEADPATVLAAAVNSFAAAAEDRAPDGGTPQVFDLPGVSASALGVGADADALEAAFTAGQQALADYLQAAPGEPADLPGLSATLEALRNGGPLTRGVSADFDLVSCEIYEPVFDDVYWGFSAFDARTTWVDGDMSTDAAGRYRYNGGTRIYRERLVDFIPDLAGGTGNAVPVGRRPFFLPDAVNGRPAIEVYELALPDGVLYSELRFDGSALVPNDYTIFVVFGFPNSVRVTYATIGGDQVIAQWNRLNWFLHGTASGPRHNLWIGYPDRQQMVYEHTGNLLQFPHRPAEGWHVYALRFGRSIGMTVFYDGVVPAEGAHDPTDTNPLLEFSGATICARWHGLEAPALGTFWMAEVIAYVGAGTDQMVVDESARLMEKYGITP